MVISKMDITILTMQAAFKIGFVGIMYMKGKKNHGKKISHIILGNLEKKDGGKSILILMFYLNQHKFFYIKILFGQLNHGM